MSGGELIGLVAVVFTTGIPIAAFYTYFRIRRLKSEERMAALARGVSVPMEPELSQVARSRRAGILLVCTAIGYSGTFALIARVEPDCWIAAAFGLGQLRKTFQTSQRLEQALGLPVLGAISLVKTEASRALEAKRLKYFMGGSAALGAVFVLLLVSEFVQRQMVA